MTTLTDFLLERIAEDERHTRKLAETDRRPVLSLAVTVNHPARLLAECEAKRRIVRRSQSAELAMSEPCEDSTYFIRMSNRDAWRLALQDLALPYADHDDYREEWKP